MTFVGDRLAGSVLSYVFFSSGFRYAAMCRGDLPASTLVLGNSRGVHSFYAPEIERLTKLKCANLSFNGLPAKALPAILDRYLKSHEPPKLLLVEVSCVGSESGRKEGNMERLSVLFGESSRVRDLFRKEDASKFMALSASHTLRFNSDLFWRSLSYLGTTDQRWIMKNSVSPSLVSELPRQSELKVSKSIEDLDAIVQVIELSRENGMRVELVMAPYLPAYAKSLTGLEDWQSWIEDTTGIEVHNFSDSLHENREFADRFHLNLDGSKHFVQMLADSGIL